MQSKFLLTEEERRILCRYYSENMRSLRKKLGIRQKQLAYALGTTQRHISEVENGKATTSWTLALAFSYFLQQFPELREEE